MDFIGRRCGSNLDVYGALKLGKAVAYMPTDRLLQFGYSDLERKDMRDNLKKAFRDMKGKAGSGPKAFGLASKMSLDTIADSRELIGTLSVGDIGDKLGNFNLDSLGNKLDLLYNDAALSEPQVYDVH